MGVHWIVVHRIVVSLFDHFSRMFFKLGFFLVAAIPNETTDDSSNDQQRHQNGCGKWFHVARCTMTLEVFGSYSAQTYAPPQDILDHIENRRPGWQESAT